MSFSKGVSLLKGVSFSKGVSLLKGVSFSKGVSLLKGVSFGAGVRARRASPLHGVCPFGGGYCFNNVAIGNGSCLNGFLRRWLLRNIAARRVVGFSKEKACARVVGFVDESSTYAKRLQTLGFTLGARVEYLRAAPFGDPVQLWLRGSRIALRRHEAEALLLEYEE